MSTASGTSTRPGAQAWSAPVSAGSKAEAGGLALNQTVDPSASGIRTTTDQGRNRASHSRTGRGSGPRATAASRAQAIASRRHAGSAQGVGASYSPASTRVSRSIGASHHDDAGPRTWVTVGG